MQIRRLEMLEARGERVLEGSRADIVVGEMYLGCSVEKRCADGWECLRLGEVICSFGRTVMEHFVSAGVSSCLQTSSAFPSELECPRISLAAPECCCIWSPPSACRLFGFVASPGHRAVIGM